MSEIGVSKDFSIMAQLKRNIKDQENSSNQLNNKKGDFLQQLKAMREEMATRDDVNNS